jgi:arylsulfatase A-like enzyme
MLQRNVTVIRSALLFCSARNGKAATRWLYLLTTFALWVFASASSLIAKEPNVLLILCDDLRWNALGYMGHPHVKTPHIDRLAAESVVFENAFCTTSLCSPSRASILSGLYAHQHGVTNNFTDYPTQLTSFPKQLQSAGYETAYIGKWHMGENNDEPRPGFDWFVTHKGQGKYFDTEFNFHGKERKVVPGYYTTVVTDMAEEWIGKQDKNKPWMLMLGQKAPHSFYVPEPKYEHSFDQVKVPYPASAFQLKGKPKWIEQRLSTWHGIYGPLFDYRKKFPDSSPEAVVDFERMVRAYWGTILSVDDSVGRLVELLRKKGELDNTVIIFMGDNGLLEGEHGMVDKRTMHEPSIRIPIVVRYPGLTPQKGQRIKEQVLTIDLAPTICELTKAAPMNNIQGRSFVKLVRNGDPEWRKSWLYYYNYEKQFPYTPNVRGIRTDKWKLIRYPHGDGDPDRHLVEFYDLENDPGELKNLAESPQHQVTMMQMNRELMKLVRDLRLENDPMPIDEGIQTGLPDKSIR